MMAHLSGIAGGLAEAISNLLPDDANYQRIRFVGGTRNAVGERPDAVEVTLDFAAVDTPFTAEMMERGPALDAPIARQLYWAEDLDVVATDRVVHLPTGDAFRVGDVTTFEFMGELVGYRAQLHEQTD